MKLFKFLTLIFIISFVHSSFAQNPYQSRYIEKSPVFPGEGNDFLKFISENMIYPEIAKTVGLQGEVMVGFTVKADGSVADVKALNELSGGCDSEAVRVVSHSMRWTPAYYDGKAVDSKVSAPVIFELNKKDIDKTFAHLKKSPYGFLFFMGGMVCTIDEAISKFGKSYDPLLITDIKKYKGDKHPMPDKQGVYLILMRSQL